MPPPQRAGALAAGRRTREALAASRRAPKNYCLPSLLVQSDLRLACFVRKAIVCISLTNKLSGLLYQNFLEFFTNKKKPIRNVLLLLLWSSKLPDFLSPSFRSYSLVC